MSDEVVPSVNESHQAIPDRPRINVKALLIVFAPAAAFAVMYLNYKPTEGALIVDTKHRRLKFEAIFNPEGFKTGDEAGYHLIVWKAGGAVKASLFQSQVSDRVILEALSRFGAKPGNNLTEECWSCRGDPDHEAPATKAEGPKMKITILWPGSDTAVPIHELLDGVQDGDIDFRYSGNQALIDVWKSGCVACLYSCPGGKLSNAAYSVRDFGSKPKRFAKLVEGLPKKGTRTTVYLTLLD